MLYSCMKYHNKAHYSVQFIKANKKGNLIISERMKKEKSPTRYCQQDKTFLPVKMSLSSFVFGFCEWWEGCRDKRRTLSTPSYSSRVTEGRLLPYFNSESCLLSSAFAWGGASSIGFRILEASSFIISYIF